MDIPSIIKQQLMCSSWMKIGSWGAHNFKSKDNNTLLFKVNGRLLKGIVSIKLDDVWDTYIISFFRNKTYPSFLYEPKKAFETIEDVYCDQMVNIIDRVVETRH